MQFKDKVYPGRWCRWFAWRPVRIGDSYYWLVMMDRRREKMWVSFGDGAFRSIRWQYRYRGEIGQCKGHRPCIGHAREDW